MGDRRTSRLETGGTGVPGGQGKSVGKRCFRGCTRSLSEENQEWKMQKYGRLVVEGRVEWEDILTSYATIEENKKSLLLCSSTSILMNTF